MNEKFDTFVVNGVLRKAGVLDKSGNMFTEECLKRTAERWSKTGKPEFASVLGGEEDRLHAMKRVENIIGRVEGISYKNGCLVADVGLLDTSKAKVVKDLLDSGNMVLRLAGRGNIKECKVRRTWGERLFTRPWKPWRRWKLIRVVDDDFVAEGVSVLHKNESV